VQREAAPEEEKKEEDTPVVQGRAASGSEEIDEDHAT